MATRRGAYPGTFNPPTVAHLAVVEAAVVQCGLHTVDLVLSAVPLGKHDDPELAPLDERRSRLEQIAAPTDWMAVRVTDRQLLVEIAEGYDVVILGADKWAQLVDPEWYGGTAARDAALLRLPHVAVAPRPPHPLPGASEHLTILDVDPVHHAVSASAVRRGERRWLAPGADTRDP